MLNHIAISNVIVPLIFAIVVLSLVNIDFKDKENYSKFGVGIILVFLGCLIMSLFGYLVGTSQKYFSEIWNYKYVSMKHEEVWTTEETRTYREACGTEKVFAGRDSKGNSKYETRIKYETKHKHYTDVHGPYFYLVDEYGKSHSVNSSEYEQWKNVWRNEKQIGMHAGTAAFLDRRIDGRIFECKWPGDISTIYPVSDIRTYVNKLRVADNAPQKYKKPSEELKLRYPRPADQRNTSPAINMGSAVFLSDSDVFKLRKMNAFLGSRHEVHCMFLIFESSASPEIVDDILSAWQGPNKNELCVFIGVESTGVIKWVRVDSWMDKNDINVWIEQNLTGQELCANILCDTMIALVPKYWFRKHFSDFDYLKVEISRTGIIFSVVGHIIVAIVGFLIYYFMQKQDKKENT